VAIQSFRDLQAWQLGMEYVLAIYAVTEEFPRDECYGLTSQLRRAAVAIPSNIRGTPARDANIPSIRGHCDGAVWPSVKRKSKSREG